MSGAVVHLLWLGCPKSLVDAENMAGLLIRSGFRLTSRPSEADVHVMTTCAFIEAARREAERFIDELVATGRPVIVTGCLVAYHGARVKRLYPGVAGFLGPWEHARAPAAVEAALEGVGVAPGRKTRRGPPADLSRALLTPPHYAYLRLSEGCSNRCAFCTIPRIRGRHRPKPFERLLAEARVLEALGVRELILIAQDTTAWRCPESRRGLCDLLEALSRLRRLKWLRLMYAHPARVDRRLAETLASGPPILPYIDMPVQHVDGAVLKKMRRAGGERAVRAAVETLRERAPELVLRTTLMTGFPGESDAAFERLLAFVKEARFERVGLFAYSAEPGTAAAAMRPPPRKTVEERLERLRRLARRTTAAFHKSLLGRVESVLVDASGKRRSLCRSRRDAPMVDAVVEAKAELREGTFAKVRFIRADATRIIGEPVGRKRN